MNTHLFYQSTNITGEGATWLSNLSLFLWVDIEGQTVYWCNPKHMDSVSSHHFDAMVSSIVPYKSGKVLLFLQNRIIAFNPLTQEEELLLSLPFMDSQLRPNDVKASPDGRLFMGVIHLTDHDSTGALYRIDHDLSIHKVLNHQSVPNGMVWNAASDTMYYVDSFRHCIECYSYCQETGEIDYRGVAVSIPEEMGVPDGMTIDSLGNLWVAHWGGFGVYVWNPLTGKLIDKINLPVPNVASCTFDDNGRLFITTARAGLSKELLLKYPLSGSLFSCQTAIHPGKNHYSFKEKGECV